jgi:hypothetical protein
MNGKIIKNIAAITVILLALDLKIIMPELFANIIQQHL